MLGSLSEKDPSNHAAMWEALLSFAKAYPGCWSHLNLPKAFLPRLWSLLRHACYGSASASFPALLPLVALLPKVGPQAPLPGGCICLWGQAQGSGHIGT